MTRLSELKSQARRAEASGDHRRAIKLYLQALEEGDSAEYAAPDPGLAVRIADLNFREGEPGKAIRYYRQAADQYAELGLITNAIAVCNKILRVFPYETDCYRTMARLHLEVGLVAEARKNLLRYVDTVTARGELQEARLAMREFLDRAPDEEIAEQLASRLLEADQRSQAISTLHGVWAARVQQGEGTGDLEARIHELVPDVDPDGWTLEGPTEETATAARPEAVQEPEELPVGTEEPEAEEVEPEEPEAEMLEAEEAEAEFWEPETEKSAVELTEQLAGPQGFGELEARTAGPDEYEPEEPEDLAEPAELEAELAGPEEPESLEAEEAEEPEPASSWNLLEAEDTIVLDLDEAPDLAAAVAELQAAARAEAAEAEDEPVEEAEAESGALAEPEPEGAGPQATEVPAVEAEEEEEHAEPVASSDAELEDVPVHVYQYEVDAPERAEKTLAAWERDETEEEDEWPARFELVGQYRELMSRARELAEEFGREPPSWQDEIEPDSEVRPWSRLPEIETGGDMSEQTENTGMSRDAGSGRSGDADAFGSGWDPWSLERQETVAEETEELVEVEEAVPAAEAEPSAPAAEAGSSAPAAEAEPEGVYAIDVEVREAPEGAAAPISNGRAAEVQGVVEEQRLGEEAELRRGLELLEELLELSPENMDLRRRKVSYARRLGDASTLSQAYLSLAHGLVDRGSRRGARILYEQVLDLVPGDEAAQAGLARLDALELQEQRRRGTQAEELPEASEADRKARRELGDRLWNEFEMTIRELPWLHAATQGFQAAGPDHQPTLQTFLMLAHYFMARDQFEEASSVLSAALELSERSDEELVDILYYLGVARRRMGDQARARELFERVARVDEDFREALEVIPEA